MDKKEVEKLVQDTVHSMKDHIRQCVDEGVCQALTRVGINPEDPMEMQRDMQFVREWRGTVASVRRKGLLTAVGILVAGMLSAVWLGLQALLSK